MWVKAEDAARLATLRTASLHGAPFGLSLREPGKDDNAAPQEFHPKAIASF